MLRTRDVMHECRSCALYMASELAYQPGYALSLEGKVGVHDTGGQARATHPVGSPSANGAVATHPLPVKSPDAAAQRVSTHKRDPVQTGGSPIAGRQDTACTR